jgi:hypothetical protein
VIIKKETKCYNKKWEKNSGCKKCDDKEDCDDCCLNCGDFGEHDDCSICNDGSGDWADEDDVETWNR